MNQAHIALPAASHNGHGSVPTSDRPGPSSVVEVGAHSIKIHRWERGSVRTIKCSYALGHEVYATGQISPSTIQKVIATIEEAVAPPAVGIGTSAVRDARNQEKLLAALQDRLDHGFHVLSAWEEASLLAHGYLKQTGNLPALIADLGGGSLELVFLTRAWKILWDSLPLGAVRLHQIEKLHGTSAQLEWMASVFRRVTIPRAPEVVATGGTIKAAARALGRKVFSREDLAGLEAVVRKNGPPACLPPERATVFLSGIRLMRGLLDAVGAERMRYFGISVGETFLALAQRSEGLRKQG